jgi:hypothetical protein
MDQNFHFGFLAANRVYKNLVILQLYFILPALATQSVALRLMHVRKRHKYFIPGDLFIHPSAPPPFFLRLVRLPSAVPYPVGSASAAIRRTRLPNTTAAASDDSQPRDNFLPSFPRDGVQPPSEWLDAFRGSSGPHFYLLFFENEGRRGWLAIRTGTFRGLGHGLTVLRDHGANRRMI